MRQHVASFANFVCRFGREKVLLDYANEIVLPAFLDDTLIREYGRTYFFFYETELEILSDNNDEPIIGIVGRFIKDTELTREQVFDPEKGIVHDEASIRSAPSAHFIFILNNHRLIYFPETTHAPDLSAFRSTTRAFLKRKHKDFIDKTYDTLKEEGEKITKKQLIAENPVPSLEVIPISGDEEIEAFLRRYRLLKKIEFRLINPNDEIDGGELFKDIREYFDALDPDTTTIETKSSDGLDVDEALPRIQAATATANQEVKLTGKDHDGNVLKGDNNEFQIGAPVDPVPATRNGITKKLFGIFENLKNSGVIKIGPQSELVTQKIRDLLGLL
jgi:hypothetical protein